MKKLILTYLVLLSFTVQAQLYLGLSRDQVETIDLPFEEVSDTSYYYRDSTSAILLTLVGDTVLVEQYLIESPSEREYVDSAIEQVYYLVDAIDDRGILYYNMYRDAYLSREDDFYTFFILRD